MGKLHLTFETNFEVKNSDEKIQKKYLMNFELQVKNIKLIFTNFYSFFFYILDYSKLQQTVRQQWAKTDIKC